MSANLPIVLLLDEYCLCINMHDSKRRLEIADLLVDSVIPGLIERLANVTLDRNQRSQESEEERLG